LEGSKISAGTRIAKKIGMEVEEFKIGYKNMGDSV
jgi:hypothetical protein